MIGDVALDFDANEGGETGFLTLTSPEVILQISMPAPDLARLSSVRNTEWSKRRSIQAGTCAGRGVHWFAGKPPAAAIVTVGDDPETAQISVVLTEKAVKQLLALVGEFAQ